MSVDLTKIISHSAYPGFHQKNLYTGSFTIAATSFSAGYSSQTFDITLSEEPTLLDVMWSGTSLATSTFSKPSGAYSKITSADMLYTDATDVTLGVPTVLTWKLSYSLTSPTNLRFTVYTYSGTFNTIQPTATVYDYRIVDYSALNTGVLAFDSRVNYLKKSLSISTEGTFTMPAESGGSVTVADITHNLGYIPFYDVSSQLFDSTDLWSTNPSQVVGAGGTEYPSLCTWVTTTGLAIRAWGYTGQYDGAGVNYSGTRTYKANIYVDYSQ